MHMITVIPYMTRSSANFITHARRKETYVKTDLWPILLIIFSITAIFLEHKIHLHIKCSLSTGGHSNVVHKTSSWQISS